MMTKTILMIANLASIPSKGYNLVLLGRVSNNGSLTLKGRNCWKKKRTKNWRIKENRSYKCVNPPLNVGNFEYDECYGDSTYRALPTYLGNISDPLQCAKKAEENKFNIFGLQYYGQCFGGNDENRAKMYGKKNNCGKLGTAWTNQLFKRNFT